MKKIAQQNFIRWNNALLSKDPKKVSALYSENCTFLPTLSPDFKKGLAGTEDYFAHFLLKNPTGKVISEAVQEITENTYVHSGMYDFTVGPENKREVVQARFSFIWQQDKNQEWKIIHHHSSLKPV